jgi:hypothetical protein
MLLLWVVLLVLLWLIFFPIGPQARFKKYEKMVHPYSGLDPANWNRFLENLHTFEQSASSVGRANTSRDDPSSQVDEAGSALYEAIEAIRDLGLSLRRADDANIQETLAGIAFQLAIEGETILNQNAISQGTYFFPKYLNDTMLDFPEHVAQDPGPVKSHGQ